MVIFEHRSGAYSMYVSTGAQKNAICSKASRDYEQALNRLFITCH